jgi:hypothetical protein
MGGADMEPKSLSGVNEHLEALSELGDPLDVLHQTLDFEYFSGWLVEERVTAMAARAAVRPSILWPWSRS